MGHKFWTDERIEQARTLHLTMTWPQVAAVMSHEYGRKISTQAAALCIYQSRDPDRYRTIKRPQKAPPHLAYVGDSPNVSRECNRPQLRPHPSTTARLMGDPQPGRTPWA